MVTKNPSSAPTTNLSYKLCNIVYSAKLAEPVNIDPLLVFLPDIKIGGRNSSVHIWRKYGSFLLQKSGRILIFKCFSQDQANNAVHNLVNELRDLYDVEIESMPTICNIVGTFDLGFRLDLGKLSQLIPRSEYFPDIHVSLFAKVGKTKATITHTGKCILFGAKTVEEFEDSVQSLTDIGYKYLAYVNDGVLP